MGDGLRELHAAYPRASLEGVEWSWLWWAVAALRCPWARVRRGDMWAGDWSAFGLVYLFQRPESMPRAVAKARREMRPGAWLVSLEFQAHDEQGRALTPAARLSLPGGRPIWVYQPVPALSPDQDADSSRRGVPAGSTTDHSAGSPEPGAR
jgi:hypothetical protein